MFFSNLFSLYNSRHSNGICTKNNTFVLSKDTKGITARSIKIEDIEGYMLPEKLIEVTGPSTNYKKQPYGAYSKDNSNYPIIYAYEKLSVINADPRKEKTLDLSDSPESFIERTTDRATTSGKLTASISIQPYQTYWDKDYTFMKDVFKPLDEANTAKGYYSSLLLPDEENTKYWVASRCIKSESDYCGFYVRNVYSGDVVANRMCISGSISYGHSRPLFPVLTLSSKLITGNATSGFSVNLEEAVNLEQVE